MWGMKMYGLYMLIPIVGVLTLSYFVLVVNRKTDSKGLKSFGVIIAILLWLVAALGIVKCVYKTTSGKCPSKYSTWKSKYRMPRHMKDEPMDGSMMDEPMGGPMMDDNSDTTD